jgi:tetratricopeptide (TPR) repeat protein
MPPLSKFYDSRGLPVAASTPAAVESLDAAILAYVGMRKDPAERTATLLQVDPECILAHCLNGYLHMHACHRAEAMMAQQDLGRAQHLAASGESSPRETLHIAALDAWCKGDLVAALECWENILAGNPLDLLALRLAQFMTSYLGRSVDILDSVARVLPAWPPGLPGYGFVLSCYAYGLEEAGDYEAAESFGRRAVEMNPQDLWGAHAVVHVMEMQGRIPEGIEWISSAQERWHECGNFVNHLWWHCGLFHLAAKQYELALALYDRRVCAEESDEYLDIANASALLWRLEQAGVSVGDRWERLAHRAARHLDEHFFVFVDLHYMIASAAGLALTDTEAFLDSCTRFAGDANCTQAGVMQNVGLPIAKAIIAHRKRAFVDAVDLLLPVKDLIHRIGGSHAQRDLFEQLLIDAAARAERLALARSLLSQKIEKRPRDLWAWRALTSVLESLGDASGVTASRIEIARILAAFS